MDGQTNVRLISAYICTKRVQSEFRSVFCVCTHFVFNCNEQTGSKEARGNQCVKPSVDGELYGHSYCLYEGS